MIKATNMALKFNKVMQLEGAYKSLDLLNSFIRPAIPFINSHLTEFYTDDYWEKYVPKNLRNDLDLKTVEQVEDHLRDFVNGNWRKYSCHEDPTLCTFEGASTFEQLIVTIARLQLSELQMSSPINHLHLNGNKLFEEHGLDTEDNALIIDNIMSPKKTHEVMSMSELILKISDNVLKNSEGEMQNNMENQKYVVDVGSGKGYLSSYLTLLHKFNVLAVDSSSINTNGCEKRSEKIERMWNQLIRRALERKIYGKCSKRGKRWKSKQTADKSNPLLSQSRGFGESRTSGENSDEGLMTDQSSSSRQTTESNHPDSNDNKLLKTLTQFVNSDFDLTTSMQQNFPAFTTGNQEFGIIGLHTCGNLGSVSLKLFISNQNAKYICNVPCCYHLLDENHLFYTDRKFQGSKSVEMERSGDSKISNDLVQQILKPQFPISNKLNREVPRAFLGRNARQMSAYSLHRMTATEKGLNLNPSIFYRCLLQMLIKKMLGEDEYLQLNEYEHHVGKIGDKCNSFKDYVELGLKNLKLDEKIKPSVAEIQEMFSTYSQQGRDRLVKYYLLRSLFASLVEAIILLDRLAYLLEKESVSEAHIVELFSQSVSPRCFALVGLKL